MFRRFQNGNSALYILVTLVSLIRVRALVIADSFREISKRSVVVVHAVGS